MSVLFGRRAETRAVSYQQLWSTGKSLDLRGDKLSTALTLVPVYAATSLIADSVAASPWAVYEDADVPAKVKDQPQLITNPGVDGIDPFTWKHQAMTSALLRGNAYGLILDADRQGIPSKVKWLHPDDVEVIETQRGAPAEFYWNGRHIDRRDLIHIPAYTVAGSVVGLSPIQQFRSQIETGIQAQTFAKNFFKRGTVPPGWLKYLPKGLTAEQSTEAKKRFVASVSSSEPFVSGNDWEYNAISVPAGDAQFLAGMKATANQIAAVYRVAPEDVGGESGGSTLKYASLEMDTLKFNTRTLRPWANRFEAVFNAYIPKGYVKFNLDASARADLKTRYEAHQIAIQSDFKTVDEVRALEELPPLTDAQISRKKELGAVA